MEGKRNSFLFTFSLHEHKKLQYMRTSNANCFEIVHRVDLPDYLMFAQDDRAEKCTRMPEAHAELLYVKMSLTCRDNFVFVKNVMTFKTCPLV